MTKILRIVAVALFAFVVALRSHAGSSPVRVLVGPVSMPDRKAANGWIATAIEEDLLDGLTRVSSIEAIAFRDHDLERDPVAASAMKLHAAVTPAGERVSIRLILSNASGAIQHERNHDLALTELPRFVASHLVAFLESAQFAVTAAERERVSRVGTKSFEALWSNARGLRVSRFEEEETESDLVVLPNAAAAKQLGKALALDRRYASARLNLARILEADYEEEAAMTAYREAVKSDRDHFLALVAGAEFSLEQDQYDQAVQFAERAVALNSSQRMAGTLLAEALVAAGRLERGAALLSELCVASTPDSGDDLSPTMRRMSPAWLIEQIRAREVCAPFAIEALESFGDVVPRPPLDSAALLHSDDPRVRRVGLWMLIPDKAPNPIPAVRDALRDPDARIRRAALRVAGARFDPALFPDVLALSRDAEEMISRFAIEIAAEKGGEAGRAAVERLLDDRAIEVRGRAAEQLAMGAPPLSLALHILATELPVTSNAYPKTVSEFDASSPDFPRLVSAVLDNGHVRPRRIVYDKVQSAAAAGLPIQQWLASTVSAEKRAAIWMLGTSEALGSVDLIRPNATSTDPVIRREAVGALARRGDDVGLRELLQMLTASDEGTRSFARRAFRDVAGTPPEERIPAALWASSVETRAAAMSVIADLISDLFERDRSKLNSYRRLIDAATLVRLAAALTGPEAGMATVVLWTLFESEYERVETVDASVIRASGIYEAIRAHLPAITPDDFADTMRYGVCRILVFDELTRELGQLEKKLRDSDPCVRRAAVAFVDERKEPDLPSLLTSLIRDPDRRVRRRVIDALGRVRDPGVVPLLLVMIRDEESHVRAEAAAGLGKFATAEAGSALVEALRDSEAEVRVAAVKGLGEIGLRCAEGELIKATTDSDREVRWYAYGSLERVATASVMPLIPKALETEKDDWVRERIPVLLGNSAIPIDVNVATRMLNDPALRNATIDALANRKDGSAVQLLSTVSRDPHFNSVAAVSVAFGATRQDVPLLLALAKHPDYEVRSPVLSRLGTFVDEPGVSKVLLAALNDGSPAAYTAAEALATHSDGARSLIALLDSPEPNTRAAAAHGLRNTDASPAIGRLTELVDDPHPAVREYAARALGRMKVKEAVPAILRALSRGPAILTSTFGNVQYDSRLWLIDALGDAGDATVVHTLVPFLDDATETVASRTVLALSRLGGDEARDAIRRALKDKRTDVRDLAIFAIADLEGIDAGPSLRELLKDEESLVRGSAAYRLGVINDRNAVPLLRPLLHDSDLLVRTYAAHALSQLGDYGGVEPMIELLRSDSDFERNYAAETLGKIGDRRAAASLAEALRFEPNSFARMEIVSALVALKDTSSVRLIYESLAEHPNPSTFDLLRRVRWFPSDADLVRRAGNAVVPGGGAYLLALQEQDKGHPRQQLQYALEALAATDTRPSGLRILATLLQGAAEIELGEPKNALVTFQGVQAISDDLSFDENWKWSELFSEWTQYWTGVAYETIGGSDARSKALKTYEDLLASLAGQQIGTNRIAESAQRLDTLARTNLGTLQLAVGQNNLERALAQGRNLETTGRIEFENEQKRYIELAQQKIAREGDYQSAQRLFEEANLRRTQYLLRNQSIRLADPEKQEVLEQHRSQVASIEALKLELSDPVQSQKRTQTETIRLEHELARKRGELQRYVRALKKTHPDLAILLSGDPAELAQVMERLPSGVALLQYFMLEEKLLTFVVRNTSIDVVETAIDKKSLQRAAMHFVSAVRVSNGLARNLKREDAAEERPYQESGKILYDALIEPVRSLLTDVTTVGIAPNAFLHFVPFAALSTDGVRYLAEEYSIFYFASVSNLWVALDRRVAAGSARPVLIAISNPDGTLRGAEREVTAIETHFNVHRTLPGSKATKKATIDSLTGEPTVLHFATHGVLDAGDSSRNYLVLADDRLSVEEIWSLPLNKVVLATLSACDTAIGETLSGDEIVSLETAFLFAGAASVVSTLWSVNDDATADLMIAYYEHLRDNPKMIALQMAQKDVRKLYPQPYFWAAFTLRGDWQ